MRTIAVIFSIIILFAASCTKEKVGANLNGRWKIGEIIDRQANEALSPPPGREDDTYIDFGNGSFNGSTLRNSFAGTFTMDGDDAIRFDLNAVTQVMEDEFGMGVLSVLMACNISSSAPCQPVVVNPQGSSGVLLEGPNRFTIRLVRY